ncbi:MAG: archaeal proteasome endopeptidase complex subunit alpha [Candidatus Pacearchaeota archaeon]
MQNQVMGYDRAASIFSPDGHLLQVEYAEKTVRLGSSSIGFACKDGVIIIADRRLKDKLIEPTSANKIAEIDSHILGTTAGIISDGRILIDRARLIAQQHRVTYDSKIDVESIIREIADIKQAYTQYGGARPFGVSLMIGGISNRKSKLYTSDVSGNYFEYKASAIGENDEKIKEMLREEFDEKMTIEEAIKLGLKIFKKILDKNFELGRFDVAYIKIGEDIIKRLEGEELKKYIK